MGLLFLFNLFFEFGDDLSVEIVLMVLLLGDKLKGEIGVKKENISKKVKIS